MRTRSVIWKIGVAWALFALPPSLTRADAPVGCAGTTLKPQAPFAKLPIQFQENAVKSSVETLALLRVANISETPISGIDMQLEYRTENGNLIGLLWYGLSTNSPPHAYFERTKDPLPPQGMITLHSESIRVFTECPKIARVLAIKVSFTGGSEFSQNTSDWMFQESPLTIAKLRIPSNQIAGRDSAHLVKFSISSAGVVSDIRELKSDKSALPASLANEVRKWRFQPKTVNGRPQPSSFLAVLRIIASGCEVSKCYQPFARSDLTSEFVLIDLRPTEPSNQELTDRQLGKFEVYFGPINVSDNGRIRW